MWLTNLKLVLPDRLLERGSLRLEDGLIAEVAEDNAGEGLNCKGLTAIPGLVDLHGDMLERELQPRPGSEFPLDLALYETDKRLVGSGITTAYAALSFMEGWGIRDPKRGLELAAAIHRHRPSLLSDWRVHARFEVTTPGMAPVLKERIANDEIHLVSLMDHTPGQGQFRDLEAYVKYYTRWLGSGSAEMEARVRDHAHGVQDAPKSWHIGREIAEVCHERGIPLASHDDDTPEKIELMAGLGTSISEFPVTLEAARAAKQRGMWVVMGAPNALRGGSHSGNLSAVEGLGAGLVDALAADYHPASLVQCAFRLADRGLLPLHASVKLVTHNVAAMCQLEDRGRLEPGLRADIVLVEEGECPRVRATFRQGRRVYWDGALEQ
ncbi:MAG: alpha-D-ribose 1-methylphosphonate 5-triphosphate diphosphatase [Meiothermus sp.]